MTDGLHWVHEVLDDPPPEPPMLIDNLMRAGELVVIAGPRGVSKSRLIYNLAGHLGFGDGAFLDCLAVHRQARPLILQGELDPWASARRWGSQLGSDRPQGIAETFEPVRLRVREVRQTKPGVGGSRTEMFHEGELDPRVEAWIAEHGFDVLILDPWATFYVGDENSNDQTEAALSQLRALALKHGTAIVIVHHLGKANDYRDPEDLWRGASRLADWASTRVTMLPHYSPKAAADAGLTLQEARQFIDLHFLRRHEPLDDFSVHVDEAGVFSLWRPPDRAESAFVGRISPDDVARACAEESGFSSIKAAARALGCSGDRAREALDRAVAAGVVVEVADGSSRRFELSPALRLDVTP
ncbi:MAG TPA: AAA family ATPase [Mycobacteriales bacterium]|nr:AAA family ATPase [Mycobacteriales bacterium]